MRRQGSLFLGLILIGVGGVFLLEATGWWPEGSSAWPGILVVVGLALFIDRLIDGQGDSWFLPVVFMGIGAFLLLKDADIINSDFVWPVILIAIGLVVLSGSMGRGTVEVDSIDIPLEGAESARVRVDHGGGELRVGSLSASSRSLCTGSVGSVEQKVNRSGTRLDVSLRQRRRSIRSLGRQFRLDFNPGVDLELDLHTGATNSRLELSRLLVNSLELKTGASSTVVYLPERGHTRVSVDAGAASVEFYVPANVAGRITSDTGIAEVDIDTNRFMPSGGGYESVDYATALDRVEISIRGGVAGFKVR